MRPTCSFNSSIKKNLYTIIIQKKSVCYKITHIYLQEEQQEMVVMNDMSVNEIFLKLFSFE